MLKGLIIKDFMNLKRNIKMFGLFTLLYGVMSFATDSPGMFSTVFILLFGILTLSIYSFDDLAKWDLFALTMPVSKDNIVQGKYIMMLLLTAIGAIYSFIFNAILYLTMKSGSMFEYIRDIGVGSALVILFYSIIIPFITKMGVEKARVILFMVYVIPFAVIMGFNRALNDNSFVIPEKVYRLFEFILHYIYFIVPILLMLILAISYEISIKIYRKKEF